MAIFEYRAIDHSGKNRKGKIDAASLKQATSKLKSQGLHIVSVSTSKENLKDNPKTGRILKKSAVPASVITSFIRQLSVLVGTGIPYDRAIEILIQESDHSAFQHVLSGIKAQIEEGSSLAVALESQPEIFPKMYVAMVRAGEAGGTLSTVLNQLTISRESNEALASKIKGALIYPVIMTIVGLFIVVFMITFIIPKVVPIFQQFDIQLPLPTQIVLGISYLVSTYWIQFIVLTVACIFTFRRFLRTSRGERIKDGLLLKIPILGNIIKKIITFRFAQTLATLLTSGVELKHSLDIVKYVMGNRVYEDIFDQITGDITKKGLDLSQALRQSSVFPGSVIQMIRVGEESSTLEEMLTKIANILENEVKQTMDKAVALIEPIMILWMAASVGFIVLAVLLPMFKLNQLI